jgi:spermidine synthase
MNRRSDPIFVLFFISGFSGLIYESVWSHYVKLFLGHAAYSQTLVLVVFVGGLALGAWLCSRIAERLRNPLRIYAAVELAIGLMALVSHWVFVSAVDWGYATLLPASCNPESTFCAGQWLLSALLLAPQSILLGATFPLVCSAALRVGPEQPGHDIAALYFLNSLGAVLGVMASAFLLIPSVGLEGTLRTAGILNVAIAVAGFALSKSVPSSLSVPVSAMADGSMAETGRGLARLLLVTSFLTGLSSFIYEIAWIRMLSLVLGASTHAFELMLASFILGLALGGLWVRQRVDHSQDPVRFLGIVQLLMGLAAAATIPVYAGGFDFMAWLLGALNRNGAGFVLFNVGSTVIALLVMLPATFLAGMTLPLITYRLLRSPTGEKALGQVYAANTLGAIVGVVLTVHLLMSWVGLKGAIIVGAAIDVALGVVLLASTSGAPTFLRRAFQAPAVAAVAGLIVLAVVFEVDPRQAASGVFRTGAARISSDSRVVFHEDGKTATIDVISASDKSIAIRTNGKVDAAIGLGAHALGDEYTMALLSLLPLGHRPEARTAAVIGFGSGMSTATLLASPNLQRVDTIEIEPAMVEGARHFRPAVERAFSDPRSRIVIDDAKSFFARGRSRYDIIVSEPSNPWVTGVASLFTSEFYARLNEYLEDGGILAQWLHTYEMDSATLASILLAVSKTFPEFMVYSSIDMDIVLIARKGGAPGPFRADALSFPALQPMLQRLKLGEADVVRRRAVGHWSTLGPYFTRFGVAPNSDYFPVVDHRASKTRFTRDRVVDMVQLQTSEVPLLEMLDHGQAPPAARHDVAQVTIPETAAASAWNAYELVVNAGAVEVPITAGSLQASAHLARSWSTGCGPELEFGQVLPHLVAMAAAMNPYLHPRQATQVWDRLSGSRCARAMGPAERNWLELFSAVAARDADRMAKAGALALQAHGDSRGPAAEYAFVAAVTAAVCRRDPARAMALLEEGTRKWLRPKESRADLSYLFAMASNKVPPRATAACPAP